MSSPFRDKHVLLTGAASGIGRALALHLARHGARLALVDIDPRGLGDVGRAVREIGATATTHEVDVADPPVIE